MPQYEYRCNSCQHEWSEFLSISERLAPESNPCPQCHEYGQVSKDVNAGNIVSGVNMVAKHSGGFRDVIDKVKKAHPGHKIGGELTP